MKPIHTLVFVALMIAMSAMTGCKKDNGYTPAVITGYDLRMCACCGGLMINFDNNPKPYSGPGYDVSNNPDSLGITSTTTFPIYMNVKWEHTPYACGNYITITSFERR